MCYGKYMWVSVLMPTLTRTHTHQVAKGDTLSSMAGRFSTSVDLLRRMNSDIDTSASILPVSCVRLGAL